MPSEPNMNSTTLNDAPRLTTSDVVTEGFILLAMALVTLALGTGLFLQFNLGFVAAVICALSAYLGLLAIHALVHRNSAVAQLKAELSHLERQFARVTGRSGQPEKATQTQAKQAQSKQAQSKTTLDDQMALPVTQKANASTSVEPNTSTQTPLPPPNLSKPVSIASQHPSQDTSSEKLTPPPPPPSSRPPRETDVEMIKGLIKKLADEVNATSELPNLQAPNAATTPPPVREAAAGPKPLAKQSLDFSKLRAPIPTNTVSSEAHGEKPSSTMELSPAIDTQALVNSSENTPEKNSSGPVSIASQVIAKQEISTPQEKTDNSQNAKDEQPVETSTDRAIEASVDALRTTAQVMRGQELLSPIANNPQAVSSPPNPPTLLDPVAKEAEKDPEPRTDTDKELAEQTELSQTPSPATKPVANEPGIFAIISEALNAGRVDVLLDPILGLENRRAQHFEISVRLRDIDNSVIDTKEHCENFTGTGLETILDRETLSRTATVALQLDSRGRHGAVFSKVAAESFAAEEFINDVYAAFQQRSTLSSQLVMTLTQQHVRRLGAREWVTLTDLKNLGFRFAVSSVTDLDMDFEDLSEKGFTFVKLDADVFLNGLLAGEVRVPADDICNHLANMNITTIVDRIEDDTMLGQLRALGVQFGQGQLFGGPRTVKAQALKTVKGNAA